MTKAERLELQKQKLVEMAQRENELHAEGKRFIAGIDEVGRGPLAGPVYAACVVMPEDWDIPGINDSKKLSARKREELDIAIREGAVAYGIGIADNHEIDEINILNATKRAMGRAIADCNSKLAAMGGQLDYILLDAVKLDTEIPQESFIKGDEKCLCIAAASIVAKVARDSYMEEMDEVYPGYDFRSNKGYGTAAHYDGLRELGYTPIHRRSFLKKFEESQSQESAYQEASNQKAWDRPTGNQGPVTTEESQNMAQKTSKKVYAVRKGRTSGIFMDWDSCRQQVEGYAGAEYKSFVDVNDAMRYISGDVSGPGAGEQLSFGNEMSAGEQLCCGNEMGAGEQLSCGMGVRAYVDGSYDSTSQMYSCGVVLVTTDETGKANIVEMKKCCGDAEGAAHRNVAGEVMGARMAIEYCLDNGIGSLEIYHDYEGVGKWADNLWKANHSLTQDYKAYVAEARKSMDIRFVKIRAHAGNKYNEMADKLAKSALGI